MKFKEKYIPIILFSIMILIFLFLSLLQYLRSYLLSSVVLFVLAVWFSFLLPKIVKEYNDKEKSIEVIKNG